MNIHRRRSRKDESYHVVALKSSTLGSLKLDPSPNQNLGDRKWVVDDHDDESENDEKRKNHVVGIDKSKEFAKEVMEAKAWSKMIDQKITKKVAPKTPIRTPPGEPETINVKELMEGLEDTSPIRVGVHVRSFSFHVTSDLIPPLETPRPIPQENGLQMDSPMQACVGSSKKEDGNLPNGNVLTVADFNPEIISAFRKAFGELPPSNPFYLKPLDCNQQVVVKNGGVEQQNVKMNGITSIEVTQEKKINGDVVEEKTVNVVVASAGYAHVNSFVDKKNSEENIDSPIKAENVCTNNNAVWIPSKQGQDETGYADTNGHTEEGTTEKDNGIVTENGHVNKTKERVILYFTSLRGVRKTYEDCCYVRLILKGSGVKVDERDVSMHSGFKEELRDLLGYGFKGGLPKVFVGEKYIGGVQEIKRMHEDGQLEKVFEGCERSDDDSGNLNGVCEACGDIRFIPCETCSGSCKIYYEYEEDDEESPEDECGFQRCPDCNENGVVRCPICCY